jgi:GntR family transcriptional regulator
LTEAIDDGELRPADRLPTESVLAQFFGVSRMTLRQALAVLAERGVLLRRRGRGGGTFVARPLIECDLTGLTGFTEQLRRANLRAEATVVSAATTMPSAAVADALGIDRDQQVHRVVRVRSGDGVPLALEHSYFPAALFPDLLQLPLTGSLYAMLAQRYDRQPATARESLHPVIADAATAALLGTTPGAALLLVERVASTAAGQPVEFARDVFRPDRVRITVRSEWTGRRG